MTGTALDFAKRLDQTAEETEALLGKLSAPDLARLVRLLFF